MNITRRPISILLEQNTNDGSVAATSPDFPYVLAIGDSFEDAETRFLYSVGLYMKSLRDDSQELPPPSTTTKIVHIDFVALA